MLTVGVDVGGTFTDVFLRSTEDNIWVAHKVPSTPPNFFEGFMSGIREAVASVPTLKLEQIDRVVHGTTVATNAILTQSGARVGFLMTEGCEDILYIGVGWRPQMYDLDMDPVEPLFLAPRRRVCGVPERLDARGNVLIPLDESRLRKVASRLVEEHDVEAIVICFLHSYANPDHEIKAKTILQEAHPHVAITISSEVLPRRREYRRLVVSGFDAYVKPGVINYLNKLGSELAASGIPGPLHIMQSNGGVAGVQSITERPVKTVLSGLAAGVIGAADLGYAAGYPDCITLDMGGTSADVALVRNGRPVVTNEGHFEDYPLHIPMVEVRTIGAGGSSIAYVDQGGGLCVGPRSAGADPGPACYNRGGDEPTVTDASFVLGYLNPKTFAGRIDLNIAKSHAAIEKHIALPLGLDVTEAALGIHRIVNSNMSQALRLVSIKRGCDPREFTFIPFGGAGTVHAGRLAEDIGIREILIPPAPGVLSAMGLMLAPVQHEAISIYEIAAQDARSDRIREIFNSLDEECREWMSVDGVSPDATGIEHFAEMRYVGQSHQLEVKLEIPLTEGGLGPCVESFHDAHKRTYGHGDGSADVEFVSLRTVHQHWVQEISLNPPSSAIHEEEPLPSARKACFQKDAGFIDVAVFNRQKLPVDYTIEGPAIIEQSDTTIVLYPGHRAVINGDGNMAVTIQ